ncbi:unnamed protein product [Umbelopsis ramanniana]
MAKRFCTSKLESFESLNSVLSYGFRGEALNSICAVSKETQIVTKTKEDAVAKLYDLDVTGSIVSEKSNVGSIGTTITAKKPFYNLPVRRQLAQKNAPQTASKIQDLLIAYGLVHPKVRFVLLHTQETVGNKKKPQNWIKPAVADQMEDVKVIFGKTLADMLDHVSIDEEACDADDIDHLQEEREDDAIRLDAVLPIKGSDPIVVCKGDHVYIYINSRPIQASKSDLKELLTLVRQKFQNASDEDNSRKTPFIMLNICLPPNQYDVNVEPSKNAVLLHQKQRVLNLVESLLDRTYSNITKQPDLGEEEQVSSNAKSTPLQTNSNNATVIEPSTTAAPESDPTSEATASTIMTSIMSNPNRQANDSTVLTGLTTSIDSDSDDDLLRTLSRPHGAAQKATSDTGASATQQVVSPRVDSTSLGAKRDSSTNTRLQEWQFKGGNKQPSTQETSGGSTDMEQEHEEPLFRTRKRLRTEESSTNTFAPPTDEALPRHSVSARRRPSHEDHHSTNAVNSFDILMTSRERLSRRLGGVEHTVIEGGPRQSSLSSFIHTSDKGQHVEASPLDRRPMLSERPSVRPSTPIQNVLQTPVETRRRRQHLTLMDVDHDLVETLNQTMTLGVNVSRIHQRYRLHQTRMTKFYRTPLGEYKSLCSQNSTTPETCHSVTSLEHDLKIYVSQYHEPSLGTMVGKVAVVHSESAKRELQYQHLMATKDLSTSLSGTEEPCNLLLSDQEQQTLNGLAQSDGVITDPRLTMNGILVQLQATGPCIGRFSSLTGVGELQEILWLIRKGERDVCGCRPAKVLQNIKETAKQKPWNKPFSIEVFGIEPRAVLMLPW